LNKRLIGNCRLRATQIVRRKHPFYVECAVFSLLFWIVAPATSLTCSDYSGSAQNRESHETISPQSVPGADIIISLPGPVIDAKMAGGGQYLVLQIEGLAGVVIYDAHAAKVVKTIQLPSDDFMIAAGGATLLISFSENNLLQSWNINGFRKLNSRLGTCQ